MPRGNGAQSKVVFHGASDSFIVFVESPEAVKDWKKDRSIPLAQVMAGFKVFQTHKHGAQGVLDGASKSTLENEFGTSNDDEVIIKILEGGEVQASEIGERVGVTNITKGGSIPH
ncbi:hypothetical protein EPUS_06250 [Endocarpon pusillum Z07020]|uniref:Ribosome maturation protein SDO1/SBDS N-terminal domain-containing protein n=1 Tax=Endocarpon pusillum (strain Z07020 / HMAS-L-300199) TaxID=1263415 RepID=U1GAS7_ENDPU|nr:uncharacterized protein EPUS_06250 [Endocarpon pusillum Z07020]ERF68806.1 hypothetical protein EPUS_06250 [Endocarpon pusillum Z07020]